MNNTLTANLTISFSCLPARKITNLDLAEKYLKDNPFVNRSKSDLALSIEKHTGILMRRYAAQNDAASDLVIKVLFPLIEKKILKKKEVGAILLATTSADFPSPATANFIHQGLGFPHGTHCLDITSSCSSFLSAMRCAFGFLSANGDCLIIASEVKHKSLADDDLRSLSLFADGASGIYLQNTKKSNAKFIFAHTEIYSEFARNICIPVGGSKEPANFTNLHKNKLCFTEPKRMYIHIVQAIISAIKALIARQKKEFPNSRLDFIFVHQANKNILKEVKSRLPTPISSKIAILMADVGNMVCASLPVLRTRVLFLKAIFSFYKKSFTNKNLLEIFLSLCAKTKIFAYEYVLNGILFKATLNTEQIFILDEGCFSLNESWLADICDSEFENLQKIFLLQSGDEKRDEKTERCDFWIAAGGGFQTIGVIHRHMSTEAKIHERELGHK